MVWTASSMPRASEQQHAIATASSTDRQAAGRQAGVANCSRVDCWQASRAVLCCAGCCVVCCASQFQVCALSIYRQAAVCVWCYTGQSIGGTRRDRHVGLEVCVYGQLVVLCRSQGSAVLAQGHCPVDHSRD